MISIIVDVEQLKSGRVSIAPRAEVGKGPTTPGEFKIATQLKSLFEVYMKEIALMTPGSSTATGEADIETLRSMEDLDLEGDGK